MNFSRKYQALIVAVLIIAGVFIFSTCMQHNEESSIVTTSSGAAFAGSASCAGCHREITETHFTTAHFTTSQLATRNAIKGSFETGKNVFPYDNTHSVAMEQRDSSFYQVAYINGEEKRASPIDIVVGSGIMGQSYLSWKNDQLFQLPVTYFGAADQWSNSPGYPHKIVFDRPITSRCLECHSTHATVISPAGEEPEKFSHNRFIYGVTCEKCHGPAAAHVDYQTKNPRDTVAKFIINPKTFSRQQQLDLCASCHGGRLQKKTPSFSFTAGDALADHYKLDTTVPNPNQVDVHGNQYGLLRSSKCFRMSDQMTCNTCHNPHANERGKTALFSQRCMTCHNTAHNNTCKMTAKIGPAINNNCIDCHMPLKSSRAITVQLRETNTAISALIRSHHIAVYEDETKTMLKFLKNQPAKE